MQRLSVLTLAMVLLVAPGLPAQPQTDLDGLVAQIHRSGCREGLETLVSLASGEDLEAQRASYLLGWCLTRGGRHQEAAQAFGAAAGHPTLRMHARLEEGLALQQAGSTANAAVILREAASHASGRLRGRAFVALGQVELARRDPAAATAALTAAVELLSSDPNAWRLLGEAAVAAGRQSLAQRALALAAWAFPGEPGEGPARTAFARLRGRALNIREVPAEIRMRRARWLARRGELEAAGVEFMGVVAARPSGRLAAEAWYRLGEIWMNTDLRASLAAFRRAAGLGWNAVGAYYWMVSIAQRLGLEAEAREASEALIRIGPSSVWAGRAWLDAGLRAERVGRVAAASAFYRRAIAATPRSHDAAEARWRLGWLALRNGRKDDAEALYREAARTAPSRGELARAWYWVAKTMEARGAAADAVLQMVAQEYPLTFYGQRARMRLGAPPPVLAPPPPRAVTREDAGPVHEELARLGLDADAASSAEDALDARPDRDFRLVGFLAEVHGRLGAHRQSVAYAEEALAGGVRDEAMWRLGYPKAYWPEVAAAAQAADIDPLLLLAVVREESRYDPHAISPARAVGLAQLLPTTAQAMTGDRAITVEKLKDPATNLRLGARYVRLQLDRFGGDLRLALAAYNAGPGAARRWVGADADPDYFIEKIGYAETRAYVRRVLGSYGIYRLLW